MEATGQGEDTGQFDPNTQELLRKLRVDPDIPFPDLSRVPHPDPKMIDEWLSEEKDPEMRVIKLKLLANIEHVSFAKLVAALAKSAGKIKHALGNKPYAVMFGDSPHSSCRWVYSLVKNALPQPGLQTWFQADHTEDKKLEAKFAGKKLEPIPNATNMTRFKQALTSQGIETFLFLDDISYTGEQMVESVKSLVIALREGRPSLTPNIIVHIPIATKRLHSFLIDNPNGFPDSEEAEVFEGVNVTVIPPLRSIRTVEQILTPAQEDYWWEKRFGRLNEGDEHRFPMDACLVYTDHKVPDNWTFPNPLATRIGLAQQDWYKGGIQAGSIVPYKRTGTKYFQDETRQYAEYTRRFVR